MNESQMRETALERLAQREQRSGPVYNREAWLTACVNGLRRSRDEQPTASTADAQHAIHRHNDAHREHLPAPATPEQITASKPWLASMRRALGR